MAESIHTLPRSRTNIHWTPPPPLEPETKPELWRLNGSYFVLGVFLPLFVLGGIMLSPSLIRWMEAHPQPLAQFNPWRELTPIEIRQRAQPVPYADLQQNTDDYVGELVRLIGTFDGFDYKDKNSGVLYLNMADPEDKSLGGIFVSAFARIAVNYEHSQLSTAWLNHGGTLTSGDKIVVYARVKGRTTELTRIGIELVLPEVTALLVE